MRCILAWLYNRIIPRTAVQAGVLRPPIGHRSWAPPTSSG